MENSIASVGLKSNGSQIEPFTSSEIHSMDLKRLFTSALEDIKPSYSRADFHTKIFKYAKALINGYEQKQENKSPYLAMSLLNSISLAYDKVDKLEKHILAKDPLLDFLLWRSSGILMEQTARNFFCMKKVDLLLEDRKTEETAAKIEDLQRRILNSMESLQTLCKKEETSFRAKVLSDRMEEFEVSSELKQLEDETFGLKRELGKLEEKVDRKDLLPLPQKRDIESLQGELKAELNYFLSKSLEDRKLYYSVLKDTALDFGRSVSKYMNTQNDKESYKTAKALLKEVLAELKAMDPFEEKRPDLDAYRLEVSIALLRLQRAEQFLHAHPSLFSEEEKRQWTSQLESLDHRLRGHEIKPWVDHRLFDSKKLTELLTQVRQIKAAIYSAAYWRSFLTKEAS
jgi:hypothetical protein